MKASKTLTSALAAVAVVGSIGLAYAQTSGTTTPYTAPADTSAQPMQNQGTTTQATMPAPSTTDSAAMQTERPARADRN